MTAESHETVARKVPRITIIASGAAVLVLIGLVALLRPGRHADPAPAETAEVPDVAKRSGDPADPIGFVGKEGPCSRPAAGARIAVLAQADSSYEAGDFAKARDRYLDLLLTGGDLGGGDGDDVVRWAHGRLALCLARIARGPDGRLLDDPPLFFREPAR